MRPARRNPDSGFWFHREWLPDPYEWLQDLDDAEARSWIEEQEAATHHILDPVPGRERLRAGGTTRAAVIEQDVDELCTTAGPFRGTRRDLVTSTR